MARTLRRLLEDACASNEAALDRGPRKALAVAWDSLDKPERSALRASCAALRDLADSLAVAVICPARHAAAGGASYVRGILARGGRPMRLELLGLVSLGASIWLPMLHEFAAARCLRNVTLSGVPLTAELAAAVAAAAPQLTVLRLSDCDALGSNSITLGAGDTEAGNGGAGGGSSSAGASSGRSSLPLAALLRAAAPTLQDLELDEQEGDWAPGLSQALQCCTQLQSAHFVPPPAAMAAVLLAAAQLSGLQQLTLRLAYMTEPVGRPTDALTERIARDMAHLTKLSELRFEDTQHIVTADALVPAVACLTGLVSLDLPYYELQRQHLQQLQTLTALTYLCVRNVQLGVAESEAAPAPGLGAQQQAPLPSLHSAAQPLPLPPHLSTLWQCGSVTPGALLSLQLPPSLNTLTVGGMSIDGCDEDGLGLQPAHAQQALDACALLAARADPRGHVGRTLWLSACGLQPPPTWAGGYDTLFAALQPLGLRTLHLRGVVDLDVGSLAERFPSLEELELECDVGLDAVPSLSRLQHLHTLRLHAACDGSWEGWDDEAAVFCALEGLVRDAPALKRLRLLAPASGAGSGSDDDDAMDAFEEDVLAAAEAAVARLCAAVEAGSLQRHCRERLSARVLVAEHCSPYEYSSTDEEDD